MLSFMKMEVIDGVYLKQHAYSNFRPNFRPQTTPPPPQLLPPPFNPKLHPIDLDLHPFNL